MIESFVLFIIIIIFIYVWKPKRPSNYPPGPAPLPIIGNALDIPQGHLHPKVEEWSQQYGPIFSLNFFNDLIVVVTGIDNVLEALRKEEFQSRQDNFASRARSFGKTSLGIFFSSGKQWSSSRKFTVKQLRAFGKSEKENVIADEISRLMDTIIEQPNVQANGIFGPTGLNVIWRLMASKRFDYNDEKSRIIASDLSFAFRQGSASGVSIVNFIPLFRFFTPSFNVFIKIMKDIQNLIKETVKEHREVLDPNNPRDLIDNYLIEMDRNKGNPDSLFIDEDLLMIGTDLFAAGSETTSGSIEFVLLYMILYPEMQEKMQEEIDRVLRGRKPVFEDRTNLHYTMAVLNEVERLNSVVPTNIPHLCTKDTTFGGYFIPKGALISMNFRCFGYDTKYWKDPEEFNPQRFLNADGQYTRPSIMPTFGLGQRTCVGEMMARNTIFLFITTFFEKFSISLPPGEPEPSTEPLPGFTTAPRPFKINVKSRY
uniref:Cytochrome P450 n=1 Tax=Graphocephala atropunctata TaxID=36148 RepID=A0A1B6KG18_9HEMI